MAHDILTNDISLVLPHFSKDRKETRGIITLLITGLAYEVISSFLHNRRHKSLHKVVAPMENKVSIQWNKLMHLEDSDCVYGVYNAEMLEKLITTIHKMYSINNPNEVLFASKLGFQFTWYLNKNEVNYYAINSLLYLRTLQEEYIKMYEEFITQLCMYAKVIRILSRGYLPISLIPPSKLTEILNTVKMAIWKTNPDYDIVIWRLHLYYDMKLVTFSVDRSRNLIVQFPVFVQPYM